MAPQDYWWIWCLTLVVGFGGCIGSFLNVVIYRLPRSLPLGRPQWSFCPNCRTSIRWYDNIPVISYFRLHGHCRTCGCGISVRYPIIEVITIIVFLILFDAFFVAGALNGIVADDWTTPAYRFAQDWPIYAAHVLLFACLIAMSAIDMEQYWVDIRFTHFAALCGFVIHTLWTPLRTPPWPRAGSTFSAAAIAALFAAIATHWVVSRLRRRRSEAPTECAPPVAGESPGDSVAVGADETAPQEPQAVAIYLGRRRLKPTAWLAGAVLVVSLGLVVARLCTPSASAENPRITADVAEGDVDTAFMLRSLPGMAFIFAVLVGGSIIKRDADQEIEEILEAERHQARRVALLELLTLLPSVAAFVVGILVVREAGPLEDAWRDLWSWQIGRHTRPLLGLGTAASGYVVAGAVGWAVRILFTLLLGKEAFGTGDIHIMAAAGAVMGWQPVVVGFFLSSILALLGWILTWPFKRGHALPMGPWITLALLLTLLVRDAVITRYIDATWFKLSFLLPGTT